MTEGLDGMAEFTEAVYVNGVLKPKEELGLREAQRVRLKKVSSVSRRGKAGERGGSNAAKVMKPRSELNRRTRAGSLMGFARRWGVVLWCWQKVWQGFWSLCPTMHRRTKTGADTRM